MGTAHRGKPGGARPLAAGRWTYRRSGSLRRAIGSPCRNASYGIQPDRSDLQGYCVLARSRVVLARIPSRSAVATFRQLHYEAVCRRNLYQALQLTNSFGGSAEIIGEDDEAITIFLQALKLGSAVGSYQLFVDGGPRIGRLLTLVYERSQTSGDGLRELLPYVGSLAARRRLHDTARSTSRPTVRRSDSLSARERDILLFISRGLSNKGIAQALKIAPETVKSHAKHIFVKLAVKTRAEAVSRAGTLGLI